MPRNRSTEETCENFVSGLIRKNKRRTFGSLPNVGNRTPFNFFCTASQPTVPDSMEAPGTQEMQIFLDPKQETDEVLRLLLAGIVGQKLRDLDKPDLGSTVLAGYLEGLADITSQKAEELPSAAERKLMQQAIEPTRSFAQAIRDNIIAESSAGAQPGL